MKRKSLEYLTYKNKFLPGSRAAPSAPAVLLPSHLADGVFSLGLSVLPAPQRLYTSWYRIASGCVLHCSGQYVWLTPLLESGTTASVLFGTVSRLTVVLDWPCSVKVEWMAASDGQVWKEDAVQHPSAILWLWLLKSPPLQAHSGDQQGFVDQLNESDEDESEQFVTAFGTWQRLRLPGRPGDSDPISELLTGHLFLDCELGGKLVVTPCFLNGT